jgi:hypothetical protein
MQLLYFEIGVGGAGGVYNKPNIIHSVHFNFIFKVRHMYNIITLFVHFHRPTCFEPLTRAHPQGHIIQNHTLVTATYVSTTSCHHQGVHHKGIQDHHMKLYG